MDPLVGDNRAKPAGAVATDAERLRLYNALATGCGTYKVDGDTLMSTYEASWNERWTGTTQKRIKILPGRR
jgi:hypothetical protein